MAAPAVETDGSLIDDTVTITYDNLFPSIDFVADVLIEYQGSIPVKINTSTVFTLDSGDQALLNLYIDGKQTDGTGAWIEWYTWTHAGGGVLIPAAELYGTQLHQGDYVWVKGYIHLPQDDDLMNLNASFTATFEVVQWNQYPH